MMMIMMILIPDKWKNRTEKMFFDNFQVWTISNDNQKERERRKRKWKFDECLSSVFLIDW